MLELCVDGPTTALEDELESVAIVVDVVLVVRSNADRTDAGDSDAGRELVTESETARTPSNPTAIASTVATIHPPTSSPVRPTRSAWTMDDLVR